MLKLLLNKVNRKTLGFYDKQKFDQRFYSSGILVTLFITNTKQKAESKEGNLNNADWLKEMLEEEITNKVWRV